MSDPAPKDDLTQQIEAAAERAPDALAGIIARTFLELAADIGEIFDLAQKRLHRRCQEAGRGEVDGE